jgi:hypothetical protein
MDLLESQNPGRAKQAHRGGWKTGIKSASLFLLRAVTSLSVFRRVRLFALYNGLSLLPLRVRFPTNERFWRRTSGACGRAG